MTIDLRASRLDIDGYPGNEHTLTLTWPADVLDGTTWSATVGGNAVDSATVSGDDLVITFTVPEALGEHELLVTQTDVDPDAVKVAGTVRSTERGTTATTSTNLTVTLTAAAGDVTVVGTGPAGAGGGGGITDGDKGDITVSGSGATWTIDDNAVSLAKLADIATASILGRTTAATGDPEVLTATQVRTLLNVEDGATADQSAAEILTAVKTVDGTGSGLDADLLDGNEATAFATAAQGTLADSAVQPGDTIPIVDGGTGAQSAAVARTNLSVYSKAEVDDLDGTYVALLNVPVVVSGTTDTLATADNGKVNRYTNASAVTVTLPTDASDDLADGFNCTLVAEGAGGLSLSTTGITVTGGANTAISQGEALVVIKTATANTWVVIGGTA